MKGSFKMEVGVYLAKTGPFSPAMLGCEMLLFEARRERVDGRASSAAAWMEGGREPEPDKQAEWNRTLAESLESTL